MEENKNLSVEEDIDLTDEDFEEEEAEGTDQPEEKSTEEKSKKQSREENKHYAELRRKNAELQKKNKDLEVKVQEANFNGRKQSISNDALLDLGLESIEDENDLFLCEEYEKAVKRGADNPALEANKAYRAKIRKEQLAKTKEETERNEQNQKVIEDRTNFKKKFGIDTSEALKDERFMDVFGDMIGYGNMTDLYSKYKALLDRDVAEKEEAKNMGTLPSSSLSSSRKSTKKSLSDLEGDDFLREFEKRYG